MSKNATRAGTAATTAAGKAGSTAGDATGAAQQTADAAARAGGQVAALPGRAATLVKLVTLRRFLRATPVLAAAAAGVIAGRLTARKS